MGDSSDRKRKSSSEPAGRSKRRRVLGVEHLSAFLERHARLVRSSGQKLSAEDYHNSRRLCYDEDHERGLFRRYEPLTGRDLYEWQRCQYALSKKVDLVQHHERPDCDGWSKEKGAGVLGPLLARCGCPFSMLGSYYVWLVDPKFCEVSTTVNGHRQVLKHGMRHDCEAEHGPETNCTD